MYKVYVLYSRNFDKLYIGYTSGLFKRLISHNELGIKDWTYKYRPWVMIHVEEYTSKKDAMLREKALKAGKRREFIRKEILPLYF